MEIRKLLTLMRRMNNNRLRRVIVSILCSIIISLCLVTATPASISDLSFRIVREGNPTPEFRPSVPNFSAFIRHMTEIDRKAKSGELGQIILVSNIKDINEGLGAESITVQFETEAEVLVRTYNEHITQHYSIEQRGTRLGDFPGGMGMVEQAGEDLLSETPVIFISDGGFNTRAAYRTLAYGYNGIMTLPGGYTFRELQLKVSLATLNLFPNEGKDFLVWVASDNFIFPGSINWNGKPLNELPQENVGFVNSGVAVKVMDENEIETLNNIVKTFSGEEKIDNAWAVTIAETLSNADRMEEFEGLISNSLPDVWTIINEGKLTELGLFAIDPSSGVMSDFKEKPPLPILLKMAAENGGKVYKNAFFIFAQKEIMQKLQVEMKNRGLDTLPVSFMQTIFESQFLSEEEWSNIWNNDPKLKDKITKENWDGLKETVEKVLSENNVQLYGIDLGADVLWNDAGNLKKTEEVLDMIVKDPKTREALGLSSTNENNLILRNGSTIRYNNVTNVYLENVVVEGGGQLIVEDGVLVKDVIFQIPERKTLTLKQGAKVLESDLRGVTISNGTKEGIIEGVIDRYFPEAGKELVVHKDEWVVSLRIKSKQTGEFIIVTGRNIISFPYKGTTIEKGLRQIRLSWSELQNLHPEYLGQYIYEVVKDKDLFSLADENITGYTFSEAQINLDYWWLYNRVLQLKHEISAIRP